MPEPPSPGDQPGPSEGRPVRDVADGYVRGLADLDPILATALGLRQGEDRLPDLSPAGQDAMDDLARATLSDLATVTGVRSGDERAIADGVNLAGYYVWSLLDNFEWGWAYQKRFGIIFVDFGTQQRIPKSSARFYADVVRANAVSTLR